MTLFRLQWPTGHTDYATEARAEEAAVDVAKAHGMAVVFRVEVEA